MKRESESARRSPPPSNLLAGVRCLYRWFGLIALGLGGLADTTFAQCVADLRGQTEANQCLSSGEIAAHVLKGTGPATLWLPGCVGGEIADANNVVIAIDRSSHMGRGESTRRWVESLEDALVDKISAGQDSGLPERIGLVLFSSDEICHPYEGGAIDFAGAFPCVYVKPASLADGAHRDALKELLAQTRGKFARDGKPSHLHGVEAMLGDFATVQGSSQPQAVLIYSDGLFGSLSPSDPYGALRLGSYDSGRAAAMSSLRSRDAKGERFAILLPEAKPTEPVVRDRDALDTMCALEQDKPADCGSTVRRDDPSSWLVNGQDLLASLIKVRDSQDKKWKNRPLVQILSADSVARHLDHLFESQSIKTAKLRAGLDGVELRIKDGKLAIDGIAQDKEALFTIDAEGSKGLSVSSSVKVNFHDKNEPDSALPMNACVADGAASSSGDSAGLAQPLGRRSLCGAITDGKKRSALLSSLAIFVILALPLLPMSLGRPFRRLNATIRIWSKRLRIIP